MSAKLPVLEILQASQNPHADAAIVEALGRADASHREALVAVLLARDSKIGLAGLVARFHDLELKLQHLVLDHSESLFGVLGRCVKAREQQTRRNAVDLVGQTGSYRLAYLLSLALHDTSTETRRWAAEVLRDLAQRYFRQEQITLKVLADDGGGAENVAVQSYSLARLAEERSYLVTAISEAMESYDVHRCPEVTEAVVWFADHLNDTLWRVLANRLSHIGRAVLELVWKSRDPRIVPFAYKALAHQDLRSAVVRMISAQQDRAFMSEFVRWGFLMADPRIRRGVGSIRSLDWLSRGGRPILDLDPELYGRAVDLILATTMSVERKVAICRDLLLSGDRRAQRAGLWGAVGIDDEMSTQLLSNVAQWSDEDLAPIALREMMRRRPEDLPSIVAEQFESGSPAVREMATQQLSGYDFEQYWGSFEMLEDPDRSRLGRALQEAGQGFVPALRSKLVGTRSSDRLRAIQIIGLLGLGGEFEEDVYRTAYDPDGYVRSAVMGLLGQMPGPTSERILLNGLNDTDERVQANSIEALERLRATDRYKAIRRHLASDDNRVRANAVKALLAIQSPEAGDILTEMLGHTEPAMRISALWVIEASRLMRLSARVLSLAKHDPDPSVRRRALHACAILTRALKGEPYDEDVPAGTRAEAKP